MVSLNSRLKKKTNKKLQYQDFLLKAINNVLSEQKHVLAIPKKIEFLIKKIWMLQWNLNDLKKNKNKLAYNLLELRSKLKNVKL